MPITRTLRLPLALAFACGAASIHMAQARAADAYRAGAASTVITPTESTWMGGYGARTEPAAGKVQELHASALAIEDPDGYVVLFINLETPHLPGELADNVARGLRERFGLQREQIVIACTHTHCGPLLTEPRRVITYPLSPEQHEINQRYTESLGPRLVEVATAAMQQRVPAELSHGVGRCGFAVNRRNNKEAQATQPGFVPAGPVDHDVPVLRVRVDGKVRAVLFGYACHCTTMSFQQWCGDYAGYAKQYIEDAHPGSTAVFIPGCGADINPIPRRSLELCQNYGRQLADSVESLLNKGMTPVRGSFRARYKHVDLDYAHVPTREELETAQRAENAYRQRWARYLLEQLGTEGALPASYSFPVQVIGLGDELAAVFLAGETVVDYSLRLKKELGAERTWVFAYSNDLCAYIPSERVLGEGGYEGRDAMMLAGRPSAWAPGLEERIVNAVREITAEVRKPKSPNRPSPASSGSE